jgi:hypothetical protein
MHELFPDHDQAVSAWMAKRGWSVTVRRSDADRDVLAWRAEGVSSAITLRVTQSVCEDVSPDALVAFFDVEKLAQKLSRAPNLYTIVMQDEGTRSTVIRQLLRAP